MHLGLQLIAIAIVGAAPILASPARPPRRTTEAPTAVPTASTDAITQPFTTPKTTIYSLGTAYGGALDPTRLAGSFTTLEPSATAVRENKADASPSLTIVINNNFPGQPVISVSYASNTYISGATTVIAPPIDGNPPAGTFATATTLVMPSGWAGRMTIGKAGPVLDYRGSKIEANYGFNGAPDAIDVDVSYVDGYSLPIVCSCAGVAVTGCNKPLFHIGNTCENVAGVEPVPVCVNSPRNIAGPATPFFAPCSGSAYTYDYDDGANSQGQCQNMEIICCIGNSDGCPNAPARQPAKRDAEMIAEKRAARRNYVYMPSRGFVTEDESLL